MVFPTGGRCHATRASSTEQLKGSRLLLVLALLEWRFRVRRRTGTMAGAFLCAYGGLRIVGELFREPDDSLGFLLFGTTVTQLLSLPMVPFGIWLIVPGPGAPA